MRLKGNQHPDGKSAKNQYISLLISQYNDIT